MRTVAIYLIISVMYLSVVYLLAWIFNDDPDNVVGWVALGGITVLVIESSK